MDDRGRAPAGGKAAATRRTLLDAALAVIAEKGYSAATVDEIVERADVSKGVAYYHFESKAAMAECILEEGVGALVDALESAAATSTGALGALADMLEVFVSYVLDNKAFGRFMLAEIWREGRIWSDSMRGYERRLVDVLAERLERGQGEGTVRAELDPLFGAVAIVSMVLTTAMCYLDGESLLAAAEDGADRDAFIGRIRDFMRHAIVCPEYLQ